MKKLIYILAVLAISPAFVHSETRGLSVNPDQILVDNVTEWPVIESVHVTNTGSVDEWVQIRVFGDVEHISVVPSRFALEAGEGRRVLLTAGSQQEQKVIGLLKISATRTNVEGVEIGSGIEIPVAVSSGALTFGDTGLAAVAAAGAGVAPSRTATLMLTGVGIVGILVIILLARRIVRYQKS